MSRVQAPSIAPEFQDLRALPDFGLVCCHVAATPERERDRIALLVLADIDVAEPWAREGQLTKKHPNSPLLNELTCVLRTELARRLQEIIPPMPHIPEGQVTRISVGRWRGVHPAESSAAVATRFGLWLRATS